MCLCLPLRPQDIKLHHCLTPLEMSPELHEKVVVLFRWTKLQLSSLHKAVRHTCLVFNIDCITSHSLCFSAACTSSQEWTMSQTSQELHLVRTRKCSSFYHVHLGRPYSLGGLLSLHPWLLPTSDFFKIQFLCLCVFSRVFLEVCAVGNLLSSTDTWQEVTCHWKTLRVSYSKLVMYVTLPVSRLTCWLYWWN